MPNYPEQISPITPRQATEKAICMIPPGVIEVVNDLLASEANASSRRQVIRIKQKDIVNAYCSRFGTDRNSFDYKWLNIESIYSKFGWKVVYDAPGYCESYDAFFNFSEI